MKRKWLVGILAIVMTAAFVTACSGTDDGGSGGGNSNSSEISSAEIVDGSSSGENSSFVEDNSSETVDSNSEEISSEESTENEYPEDYYTEGLAFTLQDDDTYAVTDYTGTATKVVIPSIYSGKAVTVISGMAFFRCGILAEIVIPNSVTRIAPFLFCQSLTNITVQKNNPEYISIDGNLYSKDGKNLIQYAIGKTATSFTISNGVTCVEPGAFFGCERLEKIVIPDGVTSIGDAAFRYCSNLTTIVIPDSVTSISDEETFDGCNNLQYTVKDELKYLGNPSNPYIYLAGTETTDITSATIESTCKFIGEYAFYDCDSLTEIVIPDSVTSVGDEVFCSCSNLTKIVIPDSITTMGEAEFEGCYNLQYTIKDGLKYLGNPNNPYMYLADTETMDITSATIENGCKFIGYETFAWREGLTKIIIPDSVTNIDSRVFFECSCLTNITVGENNTKYTSIDGNLYSKDGKTLMQYAIGKTATWFTIPGNVTSIGEDAFRGCSSLTEIVIPDSVMSIGGGAFYNCDNLTIYCEAESQPIGWEDWDESDSPIVVVWGYKGE